MIWMLMLTLLLPPPTNEDEVFLKVFENATLPNGLVLDRLSDPTTVSCAATGFTAYSKAILAQKGLLNKNLTKNKIQQGFLNTLKNNPIENQGWLYHFTDEYGSPKNYSEVSTIDTTIFYLGHLKAAELLNDDALTKIVNDSIQKININLMMKDGYFLHGYNVVNSEKIWLNELWDDYNEGVLIYKLFNKEFTPIITSLNLPLFVYYYPLCFYNDENYIKLLQNAVKYQKDTFGYLGITACDGPEGYQVGDPAVVSPLAIYAVSKYSDLAKKELNQIQFDRLTPSFSKINKWVANDKTLIDFASCYISIQN